MKYTDLLKRAYRITVRYKVLWLFGILLALTSGSGGNVPQWRMVDARAAICPSPAWIAWASLAWIGRRWRPSSLPVAVLSSS